MSTEALLAEAITAVKTGNKSHARDLLLQIIDEDERNESAWIWLSGAVENDADRRICLENVLAVNPDNRAARRGLHRLNARQESAAESAVPESAEDAAAGQVVRREYKPVSTAAAILYPDRQVQEWVWRDPTTSFQRTAVNYSQDEKFDDVWSSDVEICAYCAAKLDFQDTRCPQCKRKLTAYFFRYPQPSSHLIVFWVLLFGLSQSYLLFMLYDILAERNYLKAVGHGILLAVTFGLGTAAYLRRHWAFLMTLVVLLLILVVGVVRFVAPVDIYPAAWFELPLFGDFLRPFTNRIGQTLRIFNLGAAGLAFLYALLLVGPDFDRVPVRQAATLTKRLKTGADYHVTACRLREMGLWASAVLHWQRAVGLEPHQLSFYQQLGAAYLHLHFYDRARDIFQSALMRASHPEMRQRFETLLARVEQEAAAHQQRDQHE